MPKAAFLITDAGGGHRASAMALQAACQTHCPGLQTDIVNVYKGPWAKAEAMGRYTGFYAEDLYNVVLKHSLLGLAGTMRRTARLASMIPQPKTIQDGLAWIEAEKPDLLVSLMPFVNDLHAELARRSGRPLVLIMTDLVDERPFMWYTPKACAQAAWVNAPCQSAAVQAREAGAKRVLESGYLLHPKYLDPSLRALDRREARQRLGLDPERLTILLTMGGFGSSAMADLVEALDGHGRDWQIVAICGRNEDLKAQLSQRKGARHQVHAVGFTQDLHLYLRAADLCVGKPGPASVFEAVATATPLVMDAAAAMPQEAPNAALIALHGMGARAASRRDLPGIVAELAASPVARACQEAAQRAYPLQDAGKALALGLLEALGR